MIKKNIPLIIGKLIQFKSVFAPKSAIKDAFDIFCTPRKGKAKPNHNAFFETSIEEKHNIEGHSISTYHWKGKGDTVFLLHGWESNSFRWKNLIEKLKELDFDIIAIDAPAQGNSSGTQLNVLLYTECVNRLLKKYNPSALIGHSLGGMTSVFYQFKHKNPSIEKIVALGPPSELKLVIKGFQHTLGFSDKFINKFENYIYKRFNFKPIDFSIAKFAKELNTKGLLILDKFDELAPYKYSKRIAENWKNCNLITVENIGHSLQNKSIDNHIVNFLKEG